MFVFAPHGRIVGCVLNAPGCLHDSVVAGYGGLYNKLAQVFEENGGRCVVDSAFSRIRHPFLIKSSQDVLISSNSPSDINIAKEATSARQAAEWGMRALQGSFPGLKDRLVYEAKGER